MNSIGGTDNDPAGAAVPGATISAIGGYVPDRVLTNRDLEAMVDTSDEWIVQRTGIRERRLAGPDEFTSDLCVAAARDLSRRFDTSLEDVDFIVVATTTPDYAFPSVAAQAQDRLGIPAAGAIDLNATCAGFTYALHVAQGLVRAGLHRKVLVIAGETLSKVTDYTDRTTCILFGDGAGAALVEPAPAGGGFLAHRLGTQGAGGRHLYRQAISRRFDPEETTSYMRQNGREVYRWAVQTVSANVLALLEDAGLGPEDIDWFVPHSANLRITEALCERTGIPLDRTLESGQRFGNTSSATIPLALSEAVRAGKLRPGDTVLLYGFGGGLVHAGMICRWTAGEV